MMQTRPAVLGDPAARARFAGRLADGMVVAHGFANFYAITARPEAEAVRRVNHMKGRPENQVGSITVSPSGIADLFDWEALPAGLTRRRMLTVIDTFYGVGPFGFRGPAAAHLPDHLTFPDDGVRTAQLIAPGYACPSNTFLARCLEAAGTDLLYVTSANRSRHLTGADDSPAHWRAAGLREEFGREPGFGLLEHDDETAARAAFPQFLPMSTSVLSFHRAARPDERGRPVLTLDRHGSLAAGSVRALLDDLGLGLTVGEKASGRLTPRVY